MRRARLGQFGAGSRGELHAQSIDRGRGHAGPVVGLSAVAPRAFAADDRAKSERQGQADDKDKDIDLPPFPADASVKQVTHVAGKTLNYTATVGSLPVRDEKGKKIAEVVFTAYVAGRPAGPRPAGDLRLQRRPGRGLGLSQPRRHRAQARAVRRPGRQPLRPRAAWSTTPAPGSTSPTWCSSIPSAPASPARSSTRTRPRSGSTRSSRTSSTCRASSTTGCSKNGRMASPKYIIGESYGGYPRAARSPTTCRPSWASASNGMVMVSPLPRAGRCDQAPDFSPMPWVTTLPSMAAANYERQGKALDARDRWPRSRTTPAASSSPTC